MHMRGDLYHKTTYHNNFKPYSESAKQLSSRCSSHITPSTTHPDSYLTCCKSSEQDRESDARSPCACREARIRFTHQRQCKFRQRPVTCQLKKRPSDNDLNENRKRLCAGKTTEDANIVCEGEEVPLKDGLEAKCVQKVEAVTRKESPANLDVRYEELSEETKVEPIQSKTMSNVFFGSAEPSETNYRNTHCHSDWPTWPLGLDNITNNPPGYPKIKLPNYCIHHSRDTATQQPSQRIRSYDEDVSSIDDYYCYNQGQCSVYNNCCGRSIEQTSSYLLSENNSADSSILPSSVMNIQCPDMKRCAYSEYTRYPAPKLSMDSRGYLTRGQYLGCYAQRPEFDKVNYVDDLCCCIRRELMKEKVELKPKTTIPIVEKKSGKLVLSKRAKSGKRAISAKSKSRPKSVRSKQRRQGVSYDHKYKAGSKFDRGFKTEAHHQYHVTHSEPLPDLRDACKEGRKHNFCGVNVHLLRG